MQKVDNQIQNFALNLQEKGLLFENFEDVIPEKIGSHISSRCKSSFIVLDAFPRIGSFSIQVKIIIININKLI